MDDQQRRIVAALSITTALAVLLCCVAWLVDDYTKSPNTQPLPPIDMRQCLIDDVKAIAITRPSRSAGNRRVAKYIETELRKLGLKVERQKFARGSNIVATQKGRLSSTIVVGSHFDSVSNTPGADDNASGCAMTLLLARQISRHKTQHTFKYVFFDAEETGLHGSSYYARHMTEPCVFMLNSDMVGCLAPVTESLDPDPVFDSMFKEHPMARKFCFRRAGAVSDHASFSAIGVPYMWLFSGDHSRFHGPRDTPSTLNYDGMVTINTFALELLRRFDEQVKQAASFVESLPERTYIQ